MNEYTSVVLSTSYFPPASYFAVMAQVDRVYLEACENYQRQTYRNRCTLLAANGTETLSVPVEHSDSVKIPIRQVRIACHMPWQNKHFRALESAYRRSPFYEYYVDDLKPFFEEKPDSLYDHNTQITSVLCELIGLDITLKNTTSYQTALPSGTLDGRALSHPNSSGNDSDSLFRPEPYEQVFSLRHGFRANMSILDVIFHLGPDTKDWLIRCGRPS